MKKLKKAIGIFLCAVLCVGMFSVGAQAKKAQKYVKSVSLKRKAVITIPVGKKTATKSFKVTVKVSGKASRLFTAESSKTAVASVKVNGSKIKVTAKKAGRAKIKVTAKAKSKKGRKLSATLDLTVKKTPDESKPELEGFNVYFRNNKNWAKVNARFFNRETGESVETEMKFLEKNDKGEDVYYALFDLEKYDRAVFGNGTDETTDTPVTKASSGYYISSNDKTFNGKYLAGVYTYGRQDEGKIDSVKLAYPDGYDKTVLIWTPKGYDPGDKSKTYSVLYMSDGHNLFGKFSLWQTIEWCCDETVQSLMSNGGDGVIIVGVVTNDGNRFTELTPDVGEMSVSMPDAEYLPLDSELGGATFADFIVNDVIPYVEKNYNTNSTRGFAGSSSGGLEAFYIGMEHPDKFSYIGALSPALDFFDGNVWDEYLSGKDFSGSVPNIYLYCGNSDNTEKYQHDATAAMDGRLKAAGYPGDKIKTVLDEDGPHNEGFWAIYFPEALSFGLQ